MRSSKRTPTHGSRGAPVLLGQFLKRQAERIRDIREDPEAATAWEALFLEQGSDKEALARFRDRDPDAMMKQAEASLERVAKEFKGLPNYSNILSNAAVTRTTENVSSELYEIRNLSVGKPARDHRRRHRRQVVQAQRLSRQGRLSHFLGRVVRFLRAMLPLERSLAERMQGKPLVLLGVNGDSDVDKLRELMKRENITWRSCRDGRRRQREHSGADRPAVQSERLAYDLRHRPAWRDPP